ncbi:MAG: TIGR00725 family protein [Desulfotomaculum sp.]|nr:TIGR00725 family protein [Desulfotomaculum sp.]
MYYVGVIGSADCTEEVKEEAYRVGKEIAERGWVMICGGRGGVMEAASRGAAENNGTVVGILPGTDRRMGNRYLTLAIATGLRDARNAVIASASDGLIAVSGGWGTLSEIALARKMNRPVVALKSWQVTPPSSCEPLLIAKNAADAVKILEKIFQEP